LRMRRGILFVLSGASGVGKGTVLRSLLADDENLYFSVSWTTRKQRDGEVDAKDYHFVTRDEFEQEMKGIGFLEHAEFVGNLYGTPRRAVEKKLEAGVDVVLDVERFGALNVKKLVPDAVLIQLVPPNLSELRKRLLIRDTDTPEVIAKRLVRAQEDMLFYREFHYIVVNEKVPLAVADLQSIVQAERLKSKRINANDFAIHSTKIPGLEQDLDRLELEKQRSGAD
jgi:guanylate kinase